MTKENNAITVNFPMGSGGHIAGRLLCTCNNVAWYDHKTNGPYPWEPFDTTYNENFSLLHYDKRFKNAIGIGICSETIPPVLDMAEKQGMLYSKSDIELWKEKLYPKNFVYTLHADLKKVKEFFAPAKHFIIIPEDIDLLVERWKNSTRKYYVSPKNKKYLFEHLYKDKAKELGTTFDKCLKADLTAQIENYKNNIDENDVVVEEVKQLFDQDYFKDVCSKLNLEFNQEEWKLTVDFARRVSHL